MGKIVLFLFVFQFTYMSLFSQDAKKMLPSNKIDLKSGMYVNEGEVSVPMPQKGFYSSIDLGGEMLSLSGTYFSVPPAFLEGSKSIDRQYIVGSVGVSFGYGDYFSIKACQSCEKDMFYWGVEPSISFLIPPVEDRFDEKQYGFHITNLYKVQLSGLFGVRFKQNQLAYLHLGGAYTDINVAAGVQPFDSEKSGAVHDWLGGVAGLGYSYMLNDYLTLRAKYSFTTYFLGNKYDNEKNDGERTDYTLINHQLTVSAVFDAQNAIKYLYSVTTGNE